MNLVLEYNKGADPNAGRVSVGVGDIYIGGTYEWAYRVALSPKQAIIGFPKFGTIGIGFEKEEDWNSNLPYRCETDEIWSHIKCFVLK